MARPTLLAKKVILFAGTTSAPAQMSLTSGWNTSYGNGNANYAPVQDDIVIVTYAVGSGADRNPSIGVTTSDYNEIAELFEGTDTNETNLSVSYKRMGGTPDTAVDVTDTGNVNDAGAVVIEVWGGVDTTTAIDVTSTTATGINTGQADPPTITPSTADAVVVVCAAAVAATGNAFAQSGSELSEFLSDNSADTLDAAVGTGYFNWTSGAFDPVQLAGSTTSTSNSWCAVVLALRPAAAGGAVTGSLAATDGSDSAAFAGVVPITGTMAANDNADSASMSGKVLVSGALAAVETGQDTASISGGNEPVTGALAAAEAGSDVAALAGALGDSIAADTEVRIVIIPAEDRSVALTAEGARIAYAEAQVREVALAA